MNKPPFTWTESDRARLVPGCAVVRVSESLFTPGKLNATLLTVVKVYGDTVFFESASMMPGEAPHYFGEDISTLDPASLEDVVEFSRAEPDDDSDEPKAVH